MPHTLNQPWTPVQEPWSRPSEGHPDEKGLSAEVKSSSPEEARAWARSGIHLQGPTEWLSRAEKAQRAEQSGRHREIARATRANVSAHSRSAVDVDWRDGSSKLGYNTQQVASQPQAQVDVTKHHAQFGTGDLTKDRFLKTVTPDTDLSGSGTRSVSDPARHRHPLNDQSRRLGEQNSIFNSVTRILGSEGTISRHASRTMADLDAWFKRNSRAANQESAQPPIIFAGSLAQMGRPPKTPAPKPRPVTTHHTSKPEPVDRDDKVDVTNIASKNQKNETNARNRKVETVDNLILLSNMAEDAERRQKEDISHNINILTSQIDIPQNMVSTAANDLISENKVSLANEGPIRPLPTVASSAVPVASASTIDLGGMVDNFLKAPLPYNDHIRSLLQRTLTASLDNYRSRSNAPLAEVDYYVELDRVVVQMLFDGPPKGQSEAEDFLIRRTLEALLSRVRDKVNSHEEDEIVAQYLLEKAHILINVDGRSAPIRLTFKEFEARYNRAFPTPLDPVAWASGILDLELESIGSKFRANDTVLVEVYKIQPKDENLAKPKTSPEPEHTYFMKLIDLAMGEAHRKHGNQYHFTIPQLGIDPAFELFDMARYTAGPFRVAVKLEAGFKNEIDRHTRSDSIDAKVDIMRGEVRFRAAQVLGKITKNPREPFNAKCKEALEKFLKDGCGLLLKFTERRRKATGSVITQLISNGIRNRYDVEGERVADVFALPIDRREGNDIYLLISLRTGDHAVINNAVHNTPSDAIKLEKWLEPHLTIKEVIEQYLLKKEMAGHGIAGKIWRSMARRNPYNYRVKISPDFRGDRVVTPYKFEEKSENDLAKTLVYLDIDYLEENADTLLYTRSEGWMDFVETDLSLALMLATAAAGFAAGGAGALSAASRIPILISAMMLDLADVAKNIWMSLEAVDDPARRESALTDAISGALLGAAGSSIDIAQIAKTLPRTARALGNQLARLDPPLHRHWLQRLGRGGIMDSLRTPSFRRLLTRADEKIGKIPADSPLDNQMLDAFDSLNSVFMESRRLQDSSLGLVRESNERFLASLLGYPTIDALKFGIPDDALLRWVRRIDLGIAKNLDIDPGRIVKFKMDFKKMQRDLAGATQTLPDATSSITRKFHEAFDRRDVTYLSHYQGTAVESYRNMVGNGHSINIVGNQRYIDGVNKALDEIARTSDGEALLPELAQINPMVRINPPTLAEVAYEQDGRLYGKNSAGAHITFDPENRVIGDPGKVLRDSWRKRDSSIGLFHELLHIYYNKNRKTYFSNIHKNGGQRKLIISGSGTAADEAMITGVKYTDQDGYDFPFDDDNYFPEGGGRIFSENRFREQLASANGDDYYNFRPYYGEFTVHENVRRPVRHKIAELNFDEIAACAPSNGGRGKRGIPSCFKQGGSISLQPLENNRADDLDAEFNKLEDALNNYNYKDPQTGTRGAVFVYDVKNVLDLERLKGPYTAKFVLVKGKPIVKNTDFAEGEKLVEEKKETIVLVIGGIHENASVKIASHPAIARKAKVEEGGREVLSAGYIGRDSNGNTYVINISGHYRPTEAHMQLVIDYLKGIGVHATRIGELRRLHLQWKGDWHP
ncbi:M91 family zinc metallopeptidase [Burkholderia stagnalis]|uniref:M91 family zinc metallopeptidase n=1 Tax=Burkholderia stagnalis TaxID=1503054 RepID=UPI001C8AC340|nr:M91 family zinc metallopeptidase [Burkholderia stagnalis]